ncbi:hypothetical protein IJ103_01790 [Candidatus Saccharibacteria bacterium]|nr:hypothetical protein [Candidatus Saccharibacteria bacterium]
MQPFSREKGNRDSVLGLSSNRNFWSSTQNNSNNAYNLNVNSSSANVNNNNKTNSNYLLCYKSS